MTPAMQIALTATPLAAYFYALGLFHSGRRPRLVSGPVDVGLMAFGLGGWSPSGRSAGRSSAGWSGPDAGLLGLVDLGRRWWRSGRWSWPARPRSG